MNYEIFKDSLQKLIGFYTKIEFTDELTSAKKFFFDNTGSLDESKPSYNLRMHQFYEWYFIARPLSSYMQPPLSVCESHRDLRLTGDDHETIEILLATHQHSLFEFLKAKNEAILVRNLRNNEKVLVQKAKLVFGFDTKEYFQARTITIENKNYFLNSFCFHPALVQKFILDEVKKTQKNPDLNFEELLLRLNKMRYKFEQYKHVKPESIYKNENKLGL